MARASERASERALERVIVEREHTHISWRLLVFGVVFVHIVFSLHVKFKRACYTHVAYAQHIYISLAQTSVTLLPHHTHKNSSCQLLECFRSIFLVHLQKIRMARAMHRLTLIKIISTSKPTISTIASDQFLLNGFPFSITV